VVFADIGTSVYYVPGILYRQVGAAAGLFVTLTMIVFLLLTLKYAEVSTRFPEGGGVVTVASRGISPWAGAVGGMFILVDYFLTSAISSLSGLIYFEAVIPRIAPYVLIVTLAVMALLGLLNWYGIKESASVSLVIASIAFISDILILFFIFIHVPPGTVLSIFREMFTSAPLTPVSLLVGFAGAFLAFSGLESISQLSPVMRLPRRKTVRAALTIVVLTVAITSPLLTLFSTTLLTNPRYAPLLKHPAYAVNANPDQFISLLAGAFGGQWLLILLAITASALLIFAANTAIIGAYHVFLALSRLRFFPEAVERTSKLRGTPIVSIALATGIPMAILIAVQARLDVLGDLYAFRLPLSLTCIHARTPRCATRRRAYRSRTRSWRWPHPRASTVSLAGARCGGTRAGPRAGRTGRRRARYGEPARCPTDARIQAHVAQPDILSWLHYHSPGDDRLGNQSLQQAACDDLWWRSHPDWRRHLGLALPLPVPTAPCRLSRPRAKCAR
jgi:amino acid transporter